MISEKMDFLFAENGKIEGYCPAAKKVESGCSKAANQKGRYVVGGSESDARRYDFEIARCFQFRLGGHEKRGVTSLDLL